MILLIASASFIGFVHSLAPGHWLPVVVMAKTRRWRLSEALLGAFAAAAGHILLSITLGAISISVGSHFLEKYEETIERYGSLLLVVFGLAYAGFAYFRHSGCGHQVHHHPSGTEEKALVKLAKVPALFLFSLGLSPCIAVLPVFVAASASGTHAVLLTMVFFSIGVVAALSSATLLVGVGTARLDHKILHSPLIEHYGDVLAGISIVLMGILFFFVPLH